MTDTVATTESVVEETVDAVVETTKVDIGTDAAQEPAVETPATTEDPVSNPLSVLTPEGFDFDKVKDMIDGSSLDRMKKTLLLGAIDQAKNNRDLLKAALEQARGALGL